MHRSQRIRAEIARINIDGKGADMGRFSPLELSNVLELKPLSSEFTIINRYKIVIDEIQRLMPDEERQIQRQQVLKFSERFFNIIDVDIRVLEDNQIARQEQLKHRNKIANIERQLAFSASQATLSADEVRNKAQFTDTVSIGFVNYHKKVVSLKTLYEDIHKLKISTSLDMETVYDPKLANEQYYLSYHTPLLEVLYRMKKSLEALSEDARRAGNVELQSRSVNFLANCQNLILQLDNFLLGKACVFNRLLSFMISSQKQNIEHAIDLCRTYYTIHHNLLDSIQKNYYLMNMFDDELRVINIGQITFNLEQFFLQGDFRQLEQMTYRQKRQFQEYSANLKELRSYLCEKNTEYMKEFNFGLLNKKMKMLNSVKKQLDVAEDYMIKLTKLADPAGQFGTKIKKLRQEGSNFQARLRNLSSKQEQFSLELFKIIFLRIQEILTQLHNNKSELWQASKQKMNPQLRKFFVSDRLAMADELINYFYRIQQQLMSLFEDEKRKSTTQLVSALTNAEVTVNNCQNYLMGLELAQQANIRTWERKEQETIKKWLFEIHKAEGELVMMQVNFTDPSTVERKQTALMRLKAQLSIFQSLLYIYDTDIFVPSTMENIIKIGTNLQSKEVEVNISDHQEFEVSIDKYVKSLKIVATNPSLPPSILKIANDRLRVATEIKITYELLFKIYRELKRTAVPKEIQKKTVPLMNRPVFEYITLLYKSIKDLHNNSQALEQQTGLAPETRKFLVDVIEEFITNFQLIYHISEKQLEVYSRTLGLALDYTKISDQLISELSRAVESPIGPTWRSQVVSVCRKMADINIEISQIEKIENGELGKLNYGNFKDQLKKRADFYQLATTLAKQDDEGNVILKTTYKDNKAEQLRRKILINMAQVQGGSPATS